jgi:protein SCO1/2
VEASENRIGSAVDQILLFCFHYDPVEGKYGPAVMTFVRLGGVLTILGVAIFWWRLSRRGPAARRDDSPPVMEGAS